MSYTPVDFSSIIPDESLALVFSFLQLVDPIVRKAGHGEHASGPPQTDASQDFNTALAWIRVTFVCRRWRYLAIDEAMLWTQLTNNLGPRWLNVFVERSKNALLRINDGDFATDDPHDPLHNLISSHHGRLYQLLINSSKRCNDIVKEITSVPFDSLQIFSLMIIDARDEFSFPPEPLKLFHGHAPRLRVLVLSHPLLPFTYIDWTTSIFKNLTILHLSLNATDSTFITPAFLSGLRQMKKLEVLYVLEITNETTPFACGAACSEQAPIGMENLKILILLTSLETHAHFLHHVRLPPQTRVTLRPHVFPSPPPVEEAYYALSHGVSTVWFRDEAVRPFAAAAMAFEDPGRRGDFIIHLGLTRNNIPRRPLPKILMLDMTVDGLSGDALCVQMPADKAYRIMQHLPLDDIRSLMLVGGSSHLNRDNLSAFTGLERLHVCVTDKRRGFVDILRFLAERDASSTFLLPRLRHLSAPDFYLLTALNNFASGGLNGRQNYGDTAEARHDQARRESQLTVYLHVKEEIVLVRAGRLGETSCAKVDPARVLPAIDRLEAADFVQIVSKEFDGFSI
ncbi:hypothetical protein PENSPDRAFT_646542 [Peniophora sp. CONT]|nr:hypothetical protein PENSPDRAFT_646542 [Peniophora sp. CONT]